MIRGCKICFKKLKRENSLLNFWMLWQAWGFCERGCLALVPASPCSPWLPWTEAAAPRLSSQVYSTVCSLTVFSRNRGLFRFLGFSDLDERLLPSQDTNLLSLLISLDQEGISAFGFHHVLYPEPWSYTTSFHLKFLKFSVYLMFLKDAISCMFCSCRHCLNVFRPPIFRILSYSWEYSGKI